MNDVQDYKPGEMDVSGHEEMFHSFVRFGRRAITVAVVFLVLLAMWNA